MGTENLFEPLYPPQFSQFEQPTREAQFELFNIEVELDNLPADRGPRFELRPPGYNNDNNNVYQRRREELKQIKADVKNGLRGKIEQGLKGVDEKTAKQIRSTLEIHIGEGEYKNLSRFQIKEQRGEKKDMDASSDYMDKKLSDERADQAYRERIAKLTNPNNGNVEPDIEPI
jgi:hypothetical protein